MKPYVICHMCTSIDGRILAERWAGLSESIKSGRLFETTAASFRIGAWLVGTTTMKEFADGNFKLKAARERLKRIDHVANKTTRRAPRPLSKSFASEDSRAASPGFAIAYATDDGRIGATTIDGLTDTKLVKLQERYGLRTGTSPFDNGRRPCRPASGRPANLPFPSAPR